jgi:hypothetical protein
MVLRTVYIDIKGVEKSMPTPTVKNTFPNTYVAVLYTAFPLMFIYCKYKYNIALQISHCSQKLFFFFLENNMKNIANESCTSAIPIKINTI